VPSRVAIADLVALLPGEAEARGNAVGHEPRETGGGGGEHLAAARAVVGNDARGIEVKAGLVGGGEGVEPRAQEDELPTGLLTRLKRISFSPFDCWSLPTYSLKPPRVSSLIGSMEPVSSSRKETNVVVVGGVRLLMRNLRPGRPRTDTAGGSP
jgi:hypothetical protein